MFKLTLIYVIDKLMHPKLPAAQGHLHLGSCCLTICTRIHHPPVILQLFPTCFQRTDQMTLASDGSLLCDFQYMPPTLDSLSWVDDGQARWRRKSLQSDSFILPRFFFLVATIKPPDFHPHQSDFFWAFYFCKNVCNNCFFLSSFLTVCQKIASSAVCGPY